MGTTYALVPSPGPGGTPAGNGQTAAGIGFIVLFIVLAVLATIWIRRAAARYRRRIHDE
jgi:uncharacterized membrane protein (DUF485 family)